MSFAASLSRDETLAEKVLKERADRFRNEPYRRKLYFMRYKLEGNLIDIKSKLENKPACSTAAYKDETEFLEELKRTLRSIAPIHLREILALARRYRREDVEAAIDRVVAQLPELTAFILPGGTVKSAQLHHARSVCRRAERGVVELARQQDVPPQALVFLNRLSDLLFVLARLANHRANIPDTKW